MSSKDKLLATIDVMKQLINSYENAMDGLNTDNPIYVCFADGMKSMYNELDGETQDFINKTLGENYFTGWIEAEERYKEEGYI